MNQPRKNLIISAVIVMTALIAFIIYPLYNKLNLYELNIEVRSSEEMEQKLRLLFTFTLFFIPLIYFALEKFLKLTTKKEKLFVAGSISISGIIFWQIRIYSLNQQFKELQQPYEHVVIHYQFLKENLFLEIFLMTGIIIGAAISLLAIKRFRKIYSK